MADGRGEKDRAPATLGHAHHGHDHGAGLSSAFWLTLLLLAIKVVGGSVSHSLAVWSDAEHSLTDVLAIGLAWFGMVAARRPPTAQKTYGYHRVGILTALFNAVILVALAVYILWDAFSRIGQPAHVQTMAMILVAVLSVAINGIMALGLRDHGHDLNVKSAWLHIVGDAASSLGVIAAGIGMRVFHWAWLDPLASAVIAVTIAISAVRIAVDTINILLEAVPRGVNPQKVQDLIGDTGGVQGVHHVHIWSLAPGRVALSGHVVLGDVSLSRGDMIAQDVRSRLRTVFGIEHCTLQIETKDGCLEQDGCE